jgi:cell pole-organizing protein PopZ
MDVEDVLSSIRRLVSEESRTGSDAETTGKVTTDTDANLLQHSNAVDRDKLVLTPSLRIPETDGPAPAAADLEQRIADIESLVMSEAVEDAQSEIAQNVDMQDIEDIASNAGEDTANFAEMVEDVTEQVTEEVSADATSEMMSALHLSMKDFARVEPPLTANLSGAPSFDEDEAKDLTLTEAESAMATQEEADLNAALSDEDDLSFPSDSPFETAIEDVPEQPDFMQAVEEDTLNEEEPEFEDAPVRDTIIDREPPMTAAETEDGATAGASMFTEPMDYTDEDSFLDEETLREMVSEMVRSELQGELGDRITRNVRKLVRREIHRALASRDFE